MPSLRKFTGDEAVDKFSDYIVYVDESGDPNLDKINPAFPVFVLSFCIFEKRAYSHEVIPALCDLKYRYFGHDMVVLHEREIRKRTGAFSLMNKEEREGFFCELTKIIARSKMEIIAIVIDKIRLKERYLKPEEPYALAMKYGLERLSNYASERGQSSRSTCVICESRGAQEDRALELATRRVCDGENIRKTHLNFDIVFAPKLANSAGLQLADLTARPIGLFVMRPDQKNRTYEILKTKFWKSDNGLYEGYGLKIV